MKVQVFAVSYEDAEYCVEAGSDFIGVVADDRDKTPSSVPYEEVKKILSIIPDSKMRTALTVENEFHSIKEMVNITQPDMLHIGFEPEKIPIKVLYQLRNKFPMLKILQAIPMNNDNYLDTALKYQHYVDFFILDTMILIVSILAPPGLYMTGTRVLN